MKSLNKVVASTLLIAGTVLTPTIAYADDQSPTVILNGTQMNFPTQPYIENDYTLVPFRAIFEALGYSISWDDATQTVTATKDGLTIQMQIGSVNALVNGSEKIMQIAPELKSDHTFVPLRFVSETSGAKVDWNGATATINITVNVYVNVSNGENSTGTGNSNDSTLPSNGSNSSVGTNVYQTGGKGLNNWLDLYSNGNKVVLDDYLKSQKQDIKIGNSTFVYLPFAYKALNIDDSQGKWDDTAKRLVINSQNHKITVSLNSLEVDGKSYGSSDFVSNNGTLYVNLNTLASDLGWKYSETADGIYLTN